MPDNEAIWDEIARLQEELDELKLSKANLRQSADRIKELNEDIRKNVTEMDTVIAELKEKIG